MILHDVRLYRYALPLAGPLYVRGVSRSERRGCLLVLRSEDGLEGVGEAAPLPGLSGESIETTQHELAGFALGAPGTVVPTEPAGLRNWCATAAQRLSASSCFAVETAAATLCAAASGLSLARYLSTEARETVPVCMLAGGSPDEQRVAERVAEGYEAVKVKVGADPLADARRLRMVRDAAGGETTVCADANRRWSLTDAVAFGRAVADLGLAYIEEPCASLADTRAFVRKTGVPAAIDESLPDLLGRGEAIPSEVGTVVVKPTIVGGLFGALDLQHRLTGDGIRVVMSSSFESRIGLSAIAACCACGEAGTAAGIDTARWFTADLVRHAEPLRGGRWDCRPRPPEAGDLDMNLLVRLYP